MSSKMKSALNVLHKESNVYIAWRLVSGNIVVVMC